MREDDYPRVLDLDLSLVRSIENHRHLVAGYLIFTVVRDRAAGENHGVLTGVKVRVVAGFVILALADSNVAIRPHLIDLMGILIEQHLQPIASHLTGILFRMNVAGPNRGAGLIVVVKRVAFDRDWGFAVARKSAKTAEASAL